VDTYDPGMGFRSTLTSLDASHVVWPGWFREKYADLLTDGSTVLHTTRERKVYRYADLPDDVRTALAEIDWFGARDRPFVYIWLHECGGITRVQVNADGVRITSPDEWVPAGADEPYADRQHGGHEVWHMTCSDARRLEPLPLVVDGVAVSGAIDC
jgi:hypothetical protein